MRKIISGLLLTVAVALPVVAQAADPRDRGEGRMAERERIERASSGQAERALRSERAEVRDSRREVQDSRQDLQDSRRELRQDRADPTTSRAELRGDRRDVRRDERELVRDRAELRNDQRDLRDVRNDRRDDRRDYRRDDRRDNYRWDAGRWGRHDDRGWRFSYSTPSWNSYWTPYGFGYGDRLTISWGLRWYDRDRDGRLTDREWRRAQAAFYRFADRNRDGYVSYREYDWAVDAIRYNRYGYGYAFDY